MKPRIETQFSRLERRVLWNQLPEFANDEWEAVPTLYATDFQFCQPQCTLLLLLSALSVTCCICLLPPMLCFHNHGYSALTVTGTMPGGYPETPHPPSGGCLNRRAQ